MERLARSLRGESGQSLVLVLVLVSGFSVMALALLGLNSSAALLAQRVNQPLQGRMAGDAAVEYGINQIIEGGAAASFGASQDLFLPGLIKDDVVSITVKNVSLTSLTVSPTSATVAADPSGNTAQVFTATAYSGATLLDGQSGRPGFAPLWTVSCDGGITATITPVGRFSATAGAGSCTVKVTVNNVSATAAVTVQ